MSDANYTKNCIAYYPIYTKITGSITCGILLSQIMYWYKKTKGKEFYKIDKELQEEIQLTDNEMRSAKKKLKDFNGFPITIIDKERGFWRYIIGGSLFGLGWALVGSCPGPIFILLGTGTYAVAVVFIGALLGTYIYGLLLDYLPH